MRHQHPIRQDIELVSDIGHGTFGIVYEGWGNEVPSQCGDTFGPCAVKTIPEHGTVLDRLHFLLEANVMMQFKTAHVVKLYGVVSNGQPALVVMELMERGNLRRVDFSWLLQC